MNRDGLLQMKINSVYGLKGRIAEKFGDINVPIKLNCFDAVKEGKMHYDSNRYEYYKSR